MTDPSPLRQARKSRLGHDKKAAPSAQAQGPSLDDLARQRGEAEDRLALLRRERGAALLAGLAYDHAGIDSLMAEIDALAEAEAEITRRRRKGQEDAYRALREAEQAELAGLETQRLEAVERAEQAARLLAAALAEIFALSGRCNLALKGLTGRGGQALEPYELEARFGGRLTEAMKPVLGLRRRFGQIVFPEAYPRYAGDWRQAEAEACAGEIAAAIGGGEQP